MTAVCISAPVFALTRLASSKWSHGIDIARDWLPLALTYTAFREMEWFAPSRYDGVLESAWIKLDTLVLGAWHGRALVESLGALIPNYLELCYLLVYGVPAYGLALLYVKHRRPSVDRFLTLYLLGTLSAYALFPYFPSQPPRYAFPGLLAPTVTTFLHRFNIDVLRAGTIHTGVFPSAHVSSAFSAAWALYALFPEHKRYGWIAVFYALSVSIATIYGRYHYTTDVLGGIGISLIPAAVVLLSTAARTGTEAAPQLLPTSPKE
jgi:membrane-associated phospholipid phosphatase